MSLIEKVNIASKNAPFWTESVSGDEVFYAQIDEKVVIALVDVTGHGNGAHLFAKKIKKGSSTSHFAKQTTPRDIYMLRLIC